MIPLLIRLLLFVLFVGLVVYLVRSFFGTSQAAQKEGGRSQKASAAKCSGCRHFRGAEDDGVFCGSADFETYKTFSDVEKCLEFGRPG